jgi:putative ABC transport system permease protein
VSGPPPLLEKAIAAVLPAADREVVLSELRELYDERAQATTHGAARRWYAREALRFALFAPWARARRSKESGVSGGRRKGSGFGRAHAEVTHAARVLRRRPLVSASVVVAVAIGVATTTAVASIIDGVLLRPLPFGDPARIVWVRSQLAGRSPGRANPLDVADWRAHARSFAALSSYGTYEVTLQAERPVRIGVVAASEGLGDVLGVPALHGRLLEAADHLPGARTVVVSHELWRDHLGGDPGIVGRSIALDGRAHTVVGVLPPLPLRFPLERAGLWTGTQLPLPDDPSELGRSGVWLHVVARLAPGVTVAEADAEMRALAARLGDRYPTTNAGRTASVVPLRDLIVGPARAQVLLLAGGVALVLLIAASNLGNLLLASSYDRRREFAVRAALGAARGRLAAQILTESSLLAAVGGVVGLLLAPGLLRSLLALYPGGLPRAAEVGIDARVLLVACVAMVGAALAAGVPSLVRARRFDLQSTFRATERGTGTMRERRVRGGLVVAQVAFSVVLLYGAALLGRSFLRLHDTDAGFVAENLLAFNIALASTTYPDPVREAALHEALLARVRAMPGVVEAGTTTLLPFAPGDFLDAFQRAGHPEDVAPDLPIARLQNVTGGYIEALGLDVRQGRAIVSADRADAVQVAVVNETLARSWFPQGAVGRRILFRGVEREIVGVVSDKRHASLREAPVADLYVPKAQSDYPRLLAWVAVRARAEPAALLPALRDIVAELDPAIAIDEAHTMDARLATSLAPDRFRSALVAALALIALILAAFGIYGVIAYTVARQTREIGIRLVLGELPAGAMRRVVRGALVLAAGGAAIGIVLALAGGRLVEGVLFGVTSRDPVALLAVPATFLVVAALAAFAPARRASTVDPASAMRVD